MSSYRLKIWRGSPAKQYWEEFELPLSSASNVISALMEIRKNPINTQGKHVDPVVWLDGCLEEVCGSCAMLINSYPRQACTALIHKLIEESGPEITLAPLTKFPLVRDLWVERSQMSENLKKIQAWIEVDDYADKGYGDKIPEKIAQIRYTLSTCMSCGCCTESCPQMGPKSNFIGPAAIAQAKLFNIHPTGSFNKNERLEALMQEGGISSCGNAQNCVKVCPKNIPLTDVISSMGREISKLAIKKIFGLDG